MQKPEGSVHYSVLMKQKTGLYGFEKSWIRDHVLAGVPIVQFAAERD